MSVSAWDSYKARLEAKGASLRGARFQREFGYLNRKLPSSLSYHTAVVNGAEQQLAIINSDNFDIKTVCALPGEDILGGSLVEWAEHYWIVVSEDANKELYTKVIMQRCNYLLKWIVIDEAGDPEIIERWCYVSDGTKYLNGETMTHSDNNLSLGDTRISMMIARDQYTVKLNRSNRFLIDDYDSPTVLAYRLTKPFKLGGIFNSRGAIGYVLTEVNTEDDDNFELHIADYYKHFPSDDNRRTNVSADGTDGAGDTSEGGRRVWL
jgi:hypothetical protein